MIVLVLIGEFLKFLGIIIWEFVANLTFRDRRR